MTEIEFIERYRADKQMLESYAEHLSKVIAESIVATLGIKPTVFFKIPIAFRIKDEDSLIQKAFYKNKNYGDPYNEITDKIGGRIVVLLEEQANEVCRVIESLPEFAFSKDRDFEIERNNNPELFNYKSHHYILRNKQELTLKTTIPENTPAEIQIRTLLQHAYSELTHDTIYKPNTIASPEVKRVVAKSMALIEVTDQLFSQVDIALKRSEYQFNKIIDDTLSLIPSEVKMHTDKDLCNLILDAYVSEVELYDFSMLKKFSKEYSYLFEKISERSEYKFLYKQPVILFVYFLVHSRRKIAKAKWPLSSKDLERIFTDLGYSYDRS